MRTFVPLALCLSLLSGCKQTPTANSEKKAAENQPAAQAQTQPQTPAEKIGKTGELYPVLKGGKYGFIDHTGKMVIEPEYFLASRFFEDLAIVSKVDEKTKRTKYGFIDRKNKLVIPLKYDGVTPFSEGYAGAWDGMKAFVINKKGEAMMEPRYERVGKFVDGLAPAVIVRDVRVGVKAVDSGFIDPTGKFVIYPQFDGATNFGDGKAGVRKLGQLFSFIDKAGKTVINPGYDQVGQFSEGLAAVQLQYKWGYIDTTGKIVITPRFMSARFFSEGFAGVETEPSKFGYIDKTGDLKIKAQFDAVDQFLDGIAMVFSGSKVGYIDTSGNYVWPLTQ